MGKTSDRQKIEIVQEYLEGISSSSLGLKYGISAVAVRGILRRRGVEMRSASEAHRRYAINECFLDEINSEPKAYFLGLFCADGYLSIKRHQASITLHHRDEGVLRQLNSIIQPSKPLQFVKRIDCANQYRLAIANVRISDRLIEMGMDGNKSFSLKYPSEVPSSLQGHFLRGYFDGDGSISIREKPCHEGFFSITGTRSFVEKAQDVLVKFCDLNYTKLNVRWLHLPDIVTLNYCGNRQLRRIRSFLYNESSVFMKRKRDVFFSI